MWKHSAARRRSRRLCRRRYIEMTKILNNKLTVSKVIFARLRFVMIFVVAALVVGYWDNIRNHFDKWTRPSAAPDSLANVAAGDVEYYCPMHPEVVRSQPGFCPRSGCGMA